MTNEKRKRPDKPGFMGNLSSLEIAESASQQKSKED